MRDAYLLPYSNNTLLTYTYQLDRWLAWCAGESLEPLQVTRTDVETYIRHLHEELSQKISTVHTALVPVRGFYRFAFNEDLIARDPAAMARRPRLSRGVTDTLGLDRQQMRAFLRAGSERSARDCAIAHLLACMALRSSEACSIRIEDYQQTVRGHRILQFTGKGCVPARMPLPVPVLRALDSAADGRAQGQLLRGRDGQPLCRRGVYRVVGYLARQASISTRVTPHLLRHSSITNALESGASLRKVQDLARHSDPRTTMHYDRNRTSLDDHAVHSLVAFLSGEAGYRVDAALDEVADIDRPELPR
ncbi:tyrosine-type recombinase/integrase [Nocardioides dokdonensis]|uniref:tyrosine-type recombinase/integrase n=1 Tax=Nocardioides dokdonensis TaxID=450734 RepID=UPI00082A3907|nr:tyrosine-type recombinase/integrase [Nocardioides dokdonensis]